VAGGQVRAIGSGGRLIAAACEGVGFQRCEHVVKPRRDAGSGGATRCVRHLPPLTTQPRGKGLDHMADPDDSSTKLLTEIADITTPHLKALNEAVTGRWPEAPDEYFTYAVAFTLCVLLTDLNLSDRYKAVESLCDQLALLLACFLFAVALVRAGAFLLTAVLPGVPAVLPVGLGDGERAVS
jgi:hypothetical protein